MMDAPGVRDVLQFLPGAEKIDGRLLITDATEAALMNVNPVLPRAAGLTGVGGNASRGPNAWASFGGLPVRFNSPQSQEGARYFDEKRVREAEEAIQERIRLEELVRNGP
jgi:hypothetical protein